ncbi:MAG: prephenate/arogenate dehydrogenase family protein [Alphaproteobacteria bacterium]|nr:prephenate/arogenate dehydrogenase family protein [Alphaproteobacteria bacterium]
MADFEPFDEIAIIGIGLQGASIAINARDRGLAKRIVIGGISAENCARALELNLGQHATTNLAEAVANADCVFVAVPLGAFAAVGEVIGPALKLGAIVTDTGSTKKSVIRDLGPNIPSGVHFVPAHPIAGTEHSGPDAGVKELFDGRWCILTPPPGANEAAVQRVGDFWRATGSMIEIMEPAHHDQVLAVTSHLPHLIAFAIVGTATDMEDQLTQEVIKFSASGFRDFTRIAASDPVMWRDVFLNNREALLDCAARLSEDLARLQRAIRWGDGEEIEALIIRAREIRRALIEAKQA